MLLTVPDTIFLLFLWSSTKTVFPQLVFPYSRPMFKAPSVATHNYMNWVPEREAGAVWKETVRAYSGSSQEDRFSLSAGSRVLERCTGARTIDLSRSGDSTLGGLVHSGRTGLSQPAQGWGRLQFLPKYIIKISWTGA